jgi:hypothetical protein
MVICLIACALHNGIDDKGKNLKGKVFMMKRLGKDLKKSYHNLQNFESVVVFKNGN